MALGAMVMYALFGTCSQLVMGPEATAAIMTATIVAPLAGGDPVRYAALAATTAILVGVFGCSPVWRGWGSSPISCRSRSWFSSRTAVADQMGGKSQWFGLIAAALTVIFLLFFTPLLAPLPTVALGAIIIVASLGLLDVAAFRFLHRVRSAEFWLAVATTFGVLTVGILQGVLVAVVLSLINVIYHISHPLVFANAGFFVERLENLIANAGTQLKCVILDAEAISNFDSTAAEALENLDADLERRGVELWIARANGPLRELLEVTGLTERLGKDNIYPSVRAAVTAYHAYGATALFPNAVVNGDC